MSFKSKAQIVLALFFVAVVIIAICKYTGKSPAVLFSDGFFESIEETAEKKGQEAADKFVEELFRGI